MKSSVRVLTALLALAVLGTALAAGTACGGQDKPVVQAPPSGAVVLPDGTVATATPLPAVPPPDEVPDGLEAVWEAYSILVREYVDRDKIDPEKLTEGAIRGMVETLQDRHSAYVEPSTLKLEQANFQGKFEGIGAHVEQARDGKHIIIVAPIPGSPADKAGLKAGDIILKVDGKDAEGWSVVEGVNKIRGPRGTAVDLVVERLGETQPVAVHIVRGTIEQPSVRARLLEDAPYGVIKITSFTAETHREVREQADKLLKEGAKGLVLDVRQNPGGLLSSVVSIASDFLKDGLVTYEVDGRGNRQEWPVRDGGRYFETPVVVLVDAFSASGSEVLAGALQDHGRAVVIGTRTFGKGTVNFMRELSNGGGLYIIVARWYTPNGRLLEAKGVSPDVVVDFSEGATARTITEDVQMTAAIKQLNFQTGISSAR